ncbi:MAG: ATP-binding protein [Candidatus Sulfobium sp.]|jgi:signal transduction histidine kinase
MWIKNLRESFSFRVFRSFSISIMILSAIFALFFVYYQKSRVKENLVKEGKALSALLAYGSKTAVFAENRTLLRDAARAVLKQKNVLAVQVLTADRRVLFDEEKRSFSGNTEEFTSMVSGVELPVVSESADAIEIVSPVTLMLHAAPPELLYFEDTPPVRKESVIGFVRVVMDKKALGSETATILVRSAMIAAIFLFMGAIIIFFAIRRVTLPLTRLTDAVKSLGMGESVGKVPVETHDEVGRLAEAFNAMSENLREREKEKKSLEEKLRLARTMEAIGTLARGIAHDFNNILSTVEGSVYMLERKLYDNSPLRDYTRRVNMSVTKAKGLIQSLLTFSRTQTTILHPTEINTLIRKMKPLLANILGEDVRLELSLSESEMVIKADPVQIEQVIMNLCVNARDAMPGGGRLSMESASVIIEDKEAADRQKGGRRKYVRVMISDSGRGMDEETRERMFEPFFTTKDSGRGNGLGLSIVYGIIEQHGGRIDVRSRSGEGTEFRIYLPLVEEKIVEST